MLYWKTQFYCILLYCVSQIQCFFKNKLKVCSNPASSKFTGAIFPRAFAHLVSLSHFGNSSNIKLVHYYMLCYL